MNSNEQYQVKLQVGAGIAIVSLAMSASALMPYYDIFNTTNPSSICVDDKLLPKQSPGIKDDYFSTPMQYVKGNVAGTDSEYSDEFYCFDDNEAVEFPVVKTIKVKFNKPVIKIFEV
ncbi:MAG: hypothetical protein LBI42_09125 [Chitinispirillales bacterium]|jgi:hypothetical protein|nr:hypothetical protein [Chitinispirillales bacterium]